MYLNYDVPGIKKSSRVTPVFTCVRVQLFLIIICRNEGVVRLEADPCASVSHKANYQKRTAGDEDVGSEYGP